MHEKTLIIIYQDKEDNISDLLGDYAVATDTTSLQVLITRILKTKELKPVIYAGNFPLKPELT